MTVDFFAKLFEANFFVTSIYTEGENLKIKTSLIVIREIRKIFFKCNVYTVFISNESLEKKLKDMNFE